MKRKHSDQCFFFFALVIKLRIELIYQVTWFGVDYEQSLFFLLSSSSCGKTSRTPALFPLLHTRTGKDYRSYNLSKKCKMTVAKISLFANGDFLLHNRDNFVFDLREYIIYIFSKTVVLILSGVI